MATTDDQPAGDDAVGPEPFLKSAEAVPAIPVAGLTTDPKLWVCFYQGTWVLATLVPGIVSIQRSFAPRRGDVVLASLPKCGTTWLKAMAFATMARAKQAKARGKGGRYSFANDWYFRRGGAGNWVKHMTPDMARRLDAIVEEKLSGSGLSFSSRD